MIMNHFENNNNNNLPEKPGEVILRKLFHEFTILTGKKIDTILTSESLEKPLAKWLQRGEDPIFDQLLTAFGTAAEHCLPSQLRLLFEWYQRQIDATDVFAEENQRIIKTNQEAQFSSKSGSLTKSNIQSLDNSDIEIYYLLEKRDLAVEFIFCLVLIEVLKQLPLHPGYDDLTNHIEKLAFKHFKFREDAQSNPNLVNINMIADLYAEVIGVLAHSRFQSVRKCFMNEFNELRSRDPGPITTHSIISLLMGMKFFRIKMVPIEEFEASFQFMHECAQYFQEVKDKDIKHALAGLFVEILVPVAATVKNEVNVPCLKNFVELLYSPCLDLCTKKKHCLALFPLVTCLLCVSQKAFFLTNWHYFLAMCLGHLKNRDPKMSRVALESLYRLLWVYMIRIKCESNTATQTRLHSIVNSLFPKGSKGVVPRDTPLNIFVKIIQFIAQERLDFAMKEIVFDLLSVGRSIKMVLTPERMSIGLRSFLVVADSLQQKDGEPPMPRTLGVLPSGNTLRVKKTFLNKMLTDEMAKNIGMSHYYPYVRKTLSDILRALDQQFGRPLMMTSIQNVKEPDDMISGERKPKIDLFRTCVAAIPRLIPDGISKSDLIDLLARLTINIDEEMNVLAFQALQNLVVDFADWREDVIEGFINFILHEIQDSNQDLLMNSLRMLLQLLTSWKNTVQQQQQQQQQQHQQTNPVLLNNIPEIIGSSSKSSIHQNLQAKMDQNANVLYNVEGLALVMLCHYRQPNRRLASYILKEVRFISNLLLHGNNNNNNKNYDEPVATIIDVTCPMIIENCFPYISSSERQSIIAMSYQIDLQWLAERTNNSWISDRVNNENNNQQQQQQLNQKSTVTNLSNTVVSGTGVNHQQMIIDSTATTTVTSTTTSMNNSVGGNNNLQSGTIKSIHHSSQTENTILDQSSITAASTTTATTTTTLTSMTNTVNYDDDLKLNAWNICLMSLMAEVIKHCPNAVAAAWPIVRQRSNTLFQNIDPNPVNDNRASSILRTTSNLKRSISSYERNFYLELWKSYLMFACSIAPSSIAVSSYLSNVNNDNCASPDSLSSEKLSSSIEGSRSPIMNRGSSAQNLFKQTIPLLRAEQFDLRNAVILGLSQINPYALPDLLEELMPYFREAIDKKQENLRRRKRREMLRIQIGRLFKFISERKIFAQCPIGLSLTLIEYIDGLRSYFESETDKECNTNDIKESFCHFICNLIKSFPIETRESKLSRELRSNLFNLFATWSGKYGNMLLINNHHNHHHHHSPHRHHHHHHYHYNQQKNNDTQLLLDFSFINELEFLSIRSMATVLTAGPMMFDSTKNYLFDNTNLYQWLLNLLNATEKRINDIGLETLILLLENNNEAGPLLEWLIECCYTKPSKIADSCFIALATIFSIREYPCDRYIAIIIVTMINVACPRIEIQQLALQLLQILDNRFFFNSSNNFRDYNSRLLQEQPKKTSSSPSQQQQQQQQQQQDVMMDQINVQQPMITDDHNRSGTSIKGFEPLLIDLYCYSMFTISKRMAILHPQLTMIVFSEITYRIQTALPNVCHNLLQFLIPWLYNMQLVDTTCQPNIAQQNPDYSYSHDDDDHHHYQQNYYRYGWGSIESTQMILNNLLYITVKFGDNYPEELEKIWASLCQNRPANLKIIFRYLFILTGLSPNELLPYAKRIAIYLARAQPERVIDELMADLQAVELLSFNAERTEAFPYFRIVHRKCSATHLDDNDYCNNNNNNHGNGNNHHNFNYAIHRRTTIGGTTSVTNDSRDTSSSALITEIGTLHTKRHSKDFHTKSYDHDTLNMNGAATATTTTNNTITTTTTATTITNKSIDQYRNFDSLNGSSSSDEYNGSIELPNDDSLPISDRYIMKPSTPQPRPLPMPEYGGYYAPLKELLSGKDCTNNNNNNNNLGLPGQQQQQQQAIGFHRCFLALMLMSDVITQDIHVDWTPHIPLMLHIIFLGMDHSKPIVYEHCKQLLLNLLVACCKHEDNLTVARILLKNRIQQQNFGLSIQNNILLNFQSNNVNDQSNNNNNHTAGGGERKNPSELDLDKIFTKSSENLVSTTAAAAATTTTTVTISDSVHLNDIQLKIDKDDSDNVDDDQTAFNDDDDDEEDEENEEKSTNRNDENVDSKQNDNRPQRFSLDLYIKTLIDFISSKRGGPLWNNEDITAKVWSIRSAEQLSTFVEHVLCVFKESLPFAKIENRWADIGLWQALQCSSRHYAGRSLQIFRALKIPINRSMLSDILSRLVETVSEQGEDMQGYVTELMLTLESALDTLDLKPRSILELINQYFHFDTDSKTDVAADNSEQPQQPQQDKTNEQLEEKQDFQIDIDQQLQQQQQQQMVNRLYPAESSATLVAGTNTIRPSRAMAKHLMKVPARSNTSYSMSFPTRRFNFLDEHRPRFCTTKDVDSFYNDNRNSKGNSLANVSLGRSQSAQSLKNPPEEEDDDNQSYSLDDKNSMLAQFFCIGVIILETDYEHEFLLAIRLLDKCLQKMSLDDPECREKIEKIFVHIKWPNFSGVHQLLLKGLASNLCYEPTINLLHKLTPYLKISVIDPKKSETAFPFHVMAMLPYLLHNYDDPNVLCIQAAVSFAAWCNEHSNINLENLATVMTLYSKHCFSKENSQWTKCVVKYLYDAYPGSFVMIISFLVEVAEKGPAVFLNHILSILHFMLNYIDLNSSSRSINDDLMRVATKYIEGPQWKEALKILKLAVTRSSTLAAPSYSSNSTYASSIISSIVSCGSYSDGMSMTSSTFSESEFGSIGSSIKRELPGRTMDFTFDISQTPIVGAKFIAKRQAMTEMAANHNTSKDFGTDSAISSIATSIDNNNGGGGGSSSGVSNSIGDRNEKSDFILHKLFEVRDNFPIDNNDNESIPSNENSTTNADTIGGHNVNVDNNSTLKRSSLVATQTRIRERLVNLFNRCGKRIVGLPKSPSVIFSQNSDVGMDNHKSSMASSTEDMSATNNDVSGDSKHDDTAHGEFAYFKEFDFLEYELESQEGESLDNFNWGVRRKSLSNLDNDDISSNKTNKMNDEITNVTFEPSTSSMMMMMNSYSPRLSKNDVDECSSDDEVESVSPLYDLSSHHNQIPVFNENSSTHSRPASLISHGSSHSLVSEPELSLMNTVSSSIAAANHQPIILLSNPEAEEQCSKYFMQIINDHSGRMMAQANCLIVKILKNTFKRVIYLTRESCELLTQNVNNHMDNNNQQQQQQYGSIANRFMDLLDIISMQNDFPFIHMNERLFTMIDNLLKEQQFVIMGLHAHWETFNEKKDQLFGCILECKNFKMNNNNSNTESSSSSLDSTLISKLCQHLYRMHFQLYLLYECYLKFIDSIKSIHNYPMVINHSNEIGELKKNLIKYIGDDHHTTTTTDQQYSFSSIVSSMTTISKENEAELRDLIQTKQYSSAIQFVKILKNMMMISSGMDSIKEDLIETLLNIYCRSILPSSSSSSSNDNYVVDGASNENESSSSSSAAASMHQSQSYLIIIEPEYNLGDIIRQLMDTSFVIYNNCPN
ncbi:hypothetical protein DERF_011848 [Dermatophagoides farinae]|uniref:Protein furry-like n=1 Tax=Dermatophagoides farinae TaxID=6954 RepID=A0A922HTT3_DERFA|nr:hypothetical protein DERF_011848 [Dermatophagoides farinae]